jgi:hypothetical protein
MSAAAVQVAANIATIFASGEMLLLTRALAGAAAGLLMGLHFGYLARAHHAARLYAFCMCAYIANSILLSLVASSYLVPHFGSGGIVAALTAMAALTFCVAIVGPGAYAPLAQARGGAWHLPPLPALLALACIFMWETYMSSVWIYWRPIADSAKIPGHFANWGVSVALALQLLGVLSSAFLVERLRFLPVMVAVCLLMLGLLHYLMGHPDPRGFLIFAGCFGGAYLVAPFQVAMLGLTDSSSRAVTLYPGAAAFGAAAGPFLCAAIISSVGMHGMLYAIVGLLCAALMCGIAAAATFRPRANLVTV